MKPTRYTGHPTPLALRDAESAPGAPGEADKSVSATVSFYSDNGFPVEKTVLAVAANGYGYKIDDADRNGEKKKTFFLCSIN